MFRGPLASALQASVMPSALRLFGRLVLLIVLAHTATPTPTAPPRPEAGDALTALPPEVRLRKLHLVRPDLIPSPTPSKISCCPVSKRSGE